MLLTVKGSAHSMAAMPLSGYYCVVQPNPQTMQTKNTDQLRQEVKAHVEADAIVQGNYWDPETSKGCFIGCLAHSSSTQVIEQAYGLPTALLRIAESIFEALPKDEARNFFAALPDAVACDGKDLSKVPWIFLATILKSLPRTCAQNVIDPVISGLELLAKGEDWPAARAAGDAAADAAAYAARAAGDAAYAARISQRDLLLRLIAEAPVS